MKSQLLTTSVAVLFLWATVSSSSLSYENSKTDDTAQGEITERENYLEDIPNLPHDVEIRETSNNIVDTRSTSNKSVAAEPQTHLQPSHYTLGHLQASVGQILTSVGHLEASVDRLQDKVDQHQNEFKKTSAIESKVEQIQQSLTALKSDLAQSIRNSEASVLDSVHRLESELTSFHNNMSLEHKCMPAACVPLVRCPSGWTEFSGSCYVLKEESLTWDNAQGACRSMNASLVTINSQSENDFVTTLVGGRNIWLGLTDMHHEGTWIWVDTRPPYYTNWLAGEPNNQGGNEHCVHMWEIKPGGWNDKTCTDGKWFVCKTRAL